MKVMRVEQHIIKKSHPLWNTIDENCFYSKNLYNKAMYEIRQEYFKSKTFIGKYTNMDKLFQQTEEYKQLKSQPSQVVLQMVERVWKSFFNGLKEYNKNPSKFLGRPQLPKYLNKDGRYPWFIKNNCCYIQNGILKFKVKRINQINYTIKTNIKNGRIIQVRFIPKGTCYVMEIVYETEVPEINKESKNICSIDLGINNFATLTNNIGLNPIIVNGKGIKSINQFYNKNRSELQSNLEKYYNKSWSNKLDKLTLKRNNRVKNFIHHASKFIINYCIENDIDTLVCGYNQEWKQNINIGKQNNQNMVYIPYEMFVNQLIYKCENVGIKFITTEESYTSGTSFLDKELPIKENYNKSRRKKRGLFQSKDKLINADVNGSLQIMKKVFPNVFDYGIKGILTPTIVNVINFT